MARLKVFITSDGLTDFVVAATSKAKALSAWGIRHDVFKEGAARQSDDPALVEAALARPGEVLHRAAGTREALKRLKSAKAGKAKGPGKAALKAVAALETKVTELDAVHDRAAAALDLERAALDRREEALHARHEAKRGKLESRLREARRALNSPARG